MKPVGLAYWAGKYGLDEFDLLCLENDFKAIAAELFLLAAAHFLLLYGVLVTTSTDKKYPILLKNVSHLACVALLVTLALFLNNPLDNGIFLYHTLILDPLTGFFKIIIIVAVWFSLVVSIQYLERQPRVKSRGWEWLKPQVSQGWSIITVTMRRFYDRLCSIFCTKMEQLNNFLQIKKQFYVSKLWEKSHWCQEKALCVLNGYVVRRGEEFTGRPFVTMLKFLGVALGLIGLILLCVAGLSIPFQAAVLIGPYIEPITVAYFFALWILGWVFGCTMARALSLFWFWLVSGACPHKWMESMKFDIIKTVTTWISQGHTMTSLAYPLFAILIFIFLAVVLLFLGFWLSDEYKKCYTWYQGVSRVINVTYYGTIPLRMLVFFQTLKNGDVWALQWLLTEFCAINVPPFGNGVPCQMTMMQGDIVPAGETGRGGPNIPPHPSVGQQASTSHAGAGSDAAGSVGQPVGNKGKEVRPTPDPALPANPATALVEREASASHAEPGPSTQRRPSVGQEGFPSHAGTDQVALAGQGDPGSLTINVRDIQLHDPFVENRGRSIPRLQSRELFNDFLNALGWSTTHKLSDIENIMSILEKDPDLKLQINTIVAAVSSGPTRSRCPYFQMSVWESHILKRFLQFYEIHSLPLGDMHKVVKEISLDINIQEKVQNAVSDLAKLSKNTASEHIASLIEYRDQKAQLHHRLISTTSELAEARAHIKVLEGRLQDTTAVQARDHSDVGDDELLEYKNKSREKLKQIQGSIQNLINETE